jgi:glutathione-independent formaldehyde dehydrogenase
LGASFIFCGDFEQGRLDNAAKAGAIPVNLSNQNLKERVRAISGKDQVDCGVDCVGFESCGQHGKGRRTVAERSEVLNTLISIVKFGGGLGLPGVYLPADPGAKDDEAQKGLTLLDFGNYWNKSQFMQGGQCPVMKWNRLLLEAIIAGRTKVAEYLNVELISLDDAPNAYKAFNEGINKKFVVDPHGVFRGQPTSK